MHKTTYNIYSIHNVVFITAIIYFHHVICILKVSILHSFVLLPPWGWWYITETGRRVHIYGWF
jgi:hypothetical protein